MARLTAGLLPVLVAACSASPAPTATAPMFTVPAGSGGPTPGPAGTTVSTPGPEGGAATIEVSTLTGRIVFDDGEDIWSINANGTDVTRLTSEPYREFQAALSPDGRSIAYRAEPNNPELWIMHADGSGQHQLAPDGGFPAWSPEGSLLAFAPGGGSSGRSWIAIMNPDGSGERRLAGTDYGENPAWSPDSKRIVFTSAHSGLRHMYIVGVDDGSGVADLEAAGEGQMVAWSPDGSTIIFASHRDHADNYRDIYAMNQDGSDVRRLTNANAETPTWSPDGRYIVFSAPGGLGVIRPDGSGFTTIPIPGVGWASFPDWQ